MQVKPFESGVESFSKVPFVRILLPFIAGIILGREFSGVMVPNPPGQDNAPAGDLPLLPGMPEFSFSSGNWILLAVSVGLFLLSLKAWHRGKISIHRGALSMMLFFLVWGILLGREPEIPCIPEGIIYGRVCRDVLVKENSTRTTIDHIRYFDGEGWTGVKGKASVFLETGGAELQVGDCLLMRGRLMPHREPVNPGQFDYGRYLRGQGIFYRIYLDASCWTQISRGSGMGLKIRSLLLRRRLIEKLESGIGVNVPILSSLLLGYRAELDPRVRENFIRSGTMHILAVSGLHVGILYLLPVLLLKRLKPYPIARFAGYVLVFSGLWGYAFITGLSPSVVRAVIMCCIHGMAGLINRRVDPLHVVSLTAFIMILARPPILFEAGFQLSFAAITGIILLYPLILQRIISLMPGPRWPLNRIAQMVSVSLSAQLGTIPLVIFYFHRFSVIGVCTNLLVIPVASCILYAGLGYYLCGGLEPVAKLLACLLQRMASLLEWFTQSAASLSWSALNGLLISPLQVFLLFITGMFAVLHFRMKTGRSLALSLSGIILILAFSCLHEFSILTQRGFFVFSIPRSTSIGFVRGRQLALFGGSDLSRTDSIPYEIESFIRQRQLYIFHGAVYPAGDPLMDSAGPDEPFPGCRIIHSPEVDMIYSDFGGKKILVISRCERGVFQSLPILKTDILVLCNNPGVNIPLLVKQTGVSVVVADGSNYTSCLERLEHECSGLGIRFHSTPAMGYFRFCSIRGMKKVKKR